MTIEPHDPCGVVGDWLYVDNRGSVFGCLTCAVLSDDSVTIEPHDPRCTRLRGHVGPCPINGVNKGYEVTDLETSTPLVTPPPDATATEVIP